MKAENIRRSFIVQSETDLDLTNGYNFEKRYQYLNNLNYDIAILDRSGIKHYVRPMNIPGLPKALIVSELVSFNPSRDRPALMNYIHLLDKPEIIKEAEIDNDKFRLRDLGAKDVPEYVYNNRVQRVIKTYLITDNQLGNLEEGVYLENLDIVVAPEKIATTLNHPYSPAGRMLNSYELHEELQSCGSIRIELYEEKRYGMVKYVNLNGIIVKVNAKYDVGKLPGVYYWTIGNIDDASDRREYQHYVDWDNIHKLPFKLFDTANEAMVNGDMDKNYKLQIEQLKQQVADKTYELKDKELELKELEMQLKKTNMYDEAIVERTKQINALDTMRMKQEMDAYKHQYELQKHHNEMRSLDRRDMSDFFKWIPAVLTGVFAFVGVAAKIFGGSSK